MSTKGRIFHPALRVYQVWGSREGVGKTIFSTVMCWAAARAKRAKGVQDHVGFMKPLTTGDFAESEHVRVRNAFHKLLEGKTLPNFFMSRVLFHQQKYEDGSKMLTVRTEPSSPHRLPNHVLTDVRPNKPTVSDQDLVQGVRDYAAAHAQGLQPPGGWLFVETMKDIEARLPSGNCQANVYRPLGVPAILVSDAAKDDFDKVIRDYESLCRRDYDVQSVVVFKDAAGNHARIAEYFDKLGVHFMAMREIPERHEDPRKDSNMTKNYFSSMARANATKGLLRYLYETHNKRAKELDITVSDEEKREPSVWDKKLRFSFAVPGKHKHKE